jgi:hypothetical protein
MRIVVLTASPSDDKIRTSTSFCLFAISVQSLRRNCGRNPVSYHFLLSLIRAKGAHNNTRASHVIDRLSVALTEEEAMDIIDTTSNETASPMIRTVSRGWKSTNRNSRCRSSESLTPTAANSSRESLTSIRHNTSGLQRTAARSRSESSGMAPYAAILNNNSTSYCSAVSKSRRLKQSTAFLMVGSLSHACFRSSAILFTRA